MDFKDFDDWGDDDEELQSGLDEIESFVSSKDVTGTGRVCPVALQSSNLKAAEPNLWGDAPINNWSPQPSTSAVPVSFKAPRPPFAPGSVGDPPDFDHDSGNTWIYPSNYPVRAYQHAISEQALFKNTLVSLPTGLGKTFIAAVVMYNFYRWFPSGKLIFMAPTRTLVAQQIEACFSVMGIPQEAMILLTGSVNPEKRRAAWRDKRLFFLTPQVIANDLSRGVCPGDKIRCVVVDEAHRATGGHSYCQVLETLQQHTKHTRILALSATPGTDLQGVQQVLSNLLISHIELRSEDSPDIAPYTHTRIIDKVVVSLGDKLTDIMNQYYRICSVYITRLINLGVLYTRDETTVSKFQILKSRESVRVAPPPSVSAAQLRSAEGTFALCLTLYHALDLLQQHGVRSFYTFLHSTLEGDKGQSASRTELLRNQPFQKLMKEVQSEYMDPSRPQFLPSHPKLERLLEVVKEHFEKCQQEGRDTKVIIFSQYRDSVSEITHQLNTLAPLVKPMSFLGQSTAARGVKGISQKDQLMVVKKFKSGDYNTLVATCVGEEGLDIGEVDLIVCYDAPKSPIRLVQRMGRTGRKREGRIVVLLTKGKEEQTYNKSQFQKCSIHAILRNTDKLERHLYAHSPRMVPRDLNPVVQMLHMVQESYQVKVKPDKKAKQKKTGKKADGRLKSLFDAKNARNKLVSGREGRDQPQSVLTPSESQWFRATLKLGDGEQAKTLPKPDMLSLTSTAKWPPAAGPSVLSFGQYQPWQSSLQASFLLPPSGGSGRLVSLTRLLDSRLVGANVPEMPQESCMAAFIDEQSNGAEKKKSEKNAIKRKRVFEEDELARKKPSKKAKAVSVMAKKKKKVPSITDYFSSQSSKSAPNVLPRTENADDIKIIFDSQAPPTDLRTRAKKLLQEKENSSLKANVSDVSLPTITEKNALTSNETDGEMKSDDVSNVMESIDVPTDELREDCSSHCCPSVWKELKENKIPPNNFKILTPPSSDGEECGCPVPAFDDYALKKEEEQKKMLSFLLEWNKIDVLEDLVKRKEESIPVTPTIEPIQGISSSALQPATSESLSNFDGQPSSPIISKSSKQMRRVAKAADRTKFQKNLERMSGPISSSTPIRNIIKPPVNSNSPLSNSSTLRTPSNPFLVGDAVSSIKRPGLDPPFLPSSAQSPVLNTQRPKPFSSICASTPMPFSSICASTPKPFSSISTPRLSSAKQLFKPCVESKSPPRLENDTESLLLSTSDLSGDLAARGLSAEAAKKSDSEFRSKMKSKLASFAAPKESDEEITDNKEEASLEEKKLEHRNSNETEPNYSLPCLNLPVASVPHEGIGVGESLDKILENNNTPVKFSCTKQVSSQNSVASVKPSQAIANFDLDIDDFMGEEEMCDAAHELEQQAAKLSNTNRHLKTNMVEETKNVMLNHKHESPSSFGNSPFLRKNNSTFKNISLFSQGFSDSPLQPSLLSITQAVKLVNDSTAKEKAYVNRSLDLVSKMEGNAKSSCLPDPESIVAPQNNAVLKKEVANTNSTAALVKNPDAPSKDTGSSLSMHSIKKEIKPILTKVEPCAPDVPLFDYDDEMENNNSALHDSLGISENISSTSALLKEKLKTIPENSPLKANLECLSKTPSSLQVIPIVKVLDNDSNCEGKTVTGEPLMAKHIIKTEAKIVKTETNINLRKKLNGSFDLFDDEEQSNGSQENHTSVSKYFIDGELPSLDFLTSNHDNLSDYSKTLNTMDSPVKNDPHQNSFKVPTPVKKNTKSVSPIKKISIIASPSVEQNHLPNTCSISPVLTSKLSTSRSDVSKRVKRLSLARKENSNVIPPDKSTSQDSSYSISPDNLATVPVNTPSRSETNKPKEVTFKMMDLSDFELEEGDPLPDIPCDFNTSDAKSNASFPPATQNSPFIVKRTLSNRPANRLLDSDDSFEVHGNDILKISSPKRTECLDKTNSGHTSIPYGFDKSADAFPKSSHVKDASCSKLRKKCTVNFGLDFNSDDDFENSTLVYPSEPKAEQDFNAAGAPRKKKTRKGADFLQLEASVSSQNTQSSDEEEDLGPDEYDMSFVNDQMNPTQAPGVDMRGVYLQSVKSPPKPRVRESQKNGRFFSRADVCSQVADYEDDEEYGESDDSFVVSNDCIEYETQANLTKYSADDTLMAPPPKPSRKRKRIVVNDSSSSEESPEKTSPPARKRIACVSSSEDDASPEKQKSNPGTEYKSSFSKIGCSVSSPMTSDSISKPTFDLLSDDDFDDNFNFKALAESAKKKMNFSTNNSVSREKITKPNSNSQSSANTSQWLPLINPMKSVLRTSVRKVSAPKTASPPPKKTLPAPEPQTVVRAPTSVANPNETLRPLAVVPPFRQPNSSASLQSKSTPTPLLSSKPCQPSTSSSTSSSTTFSTTSSTSSDFLIIASSTEISSGGGMVATHLRQAHGCPVHVASLNEADYVLSSRMGALRVPSSTWASSAHRGRLVERVRALQSAYSRPVIVVESTRGYDGTPRSRYLNTIVCATLQLDAVRLLHSNSHSQTASLISRLAQKEQLAGHALQIPFSVLPNLAQRVEFYLSMPGVNFASALCLSYNFATVAEVLKSSQGQLVQKGKLSAAHARTLFEHFRVTFRKDML